MAKVELTGLGIMRILLVHPDNKRNLLVGSYSVDPLGLEYIAARLTQAGYNVRIISSIQFSYSTIERELSAFKPDIVGFSVYTFTVKLSLDMAKFTKDKSSRTKVVFGGYHPTACPDIVENQFVDFVVCGEGENAFRDLINFLEKGRTDFDNIPGVFYWDNGLKGARSQQRVDFASLPQPLRNEKLLEKNKVRQIIYPPISKQKNVAQVTYSRGCPYNCQFCTSQLMFPGGVVWRHPSDVVRELEELSSNFGVNLVFFSDLTFNASKRKVHALCDEMIKASLCIKWCTLCRIDIMDKELLSHMKEAGCVKISYGIETVSEPASTSIKYHSTYDKQKFLDIITLTSKTCLLVRGLFILGFPGDNLESIEELTDFVIESDLDDIRISFCAPFPGTELYSKCKDSGIITSKNFSDFSTEKPVITLQDNLHKKLSEARRDIIRKFYSSEKYKTHYLDRVRKEPFLKDSYVEYFYLLRERRFITNNIFRDLVVNRDVKLCADIDAKVMSETESEQKLR